MEKRYNHKEWEEKLKQAWEEKKTYAAKNNPGPSFSIDTPPPTVSGSLHIGHIFSYTHTDILARHKRMSGFSVFYPFGFDDNGLPTERYVEKKCKVRSHQMGRTNFINLCLEETKSAEKAFKSLWQQMGLSVDWDVCYSTISEPVRRLSQESFIELYKNGFIYRKNKPAPYCPTCRTSVAQAELDDVEQASFFNDIIFKDGKGNNLIIGTTRPELLPACVALLYHPDDKRYQHLEGQTAISPLFNKEVPIIADETVAIDKGTGLVMCCTFGDKNDIAWFEKYSLPYIQAIGLDGRMTDQTGILAGLKITEARKKVLEELEKENLLVAQKPISHAVNVHERCKKEVEFVSLPQWFINLLDYKKEFLAAGDEIAWNPSFMKTRYRDWVENLGWDWCISRQRFYGIPFPVWHCNACGEVILADSQQLPVDPQETAFSGTCPACGSSDITGDTDIMDTWNTSSITPYICYELFNKETPSALHDKDVKEFLPMSMRPQAHDIIRTWAFYTIVKAWMHSKTLPWKEVVISGHVLSDNKEKLSKSKGGGKLTPEHLLSQYSADAIRYWTASARLGYDVSFSENQLKIGQKLTTKLWNAFRFTQEHIQGLNTPEIEPKELGTINKWLLHQATKAFNEYQAYFKKHEFSLALEPIEKFFWHDFCDNYLELIKDQLFNPSNYSDELVQTTRWTLYHVGLRILQLYAPYVPYVTEALYQTIYAPTEKKDSIHQTAYDKAQTPYTFDEAVHNTNIIIEVVGQVRSLKTDQHLSLKTALECLTISGDNESVLAMLQEHQQIIAGITQAQKIVYQANKKQQPAIEQHNDAWSADVALKTVEK